MRCQPQVFLHTAVIFTGNPEMKQRLFMRLIGGHSITDIGLGMKLASASWHKQDEVSVKISIIL